MLHIKMIKYHPIVKREEPVDKYFAVCFPLINPFVYGQGYHSNTFLIQIKKNIMVIVLVTLCIKKYYSIGMRSSAHALINVLS